MAALPPGQTRLLSRTTSPPARRTARGHSALVMTVVHNPEDSRIRQRQIEALIAAGWQVTYAAPFRAFGLEVPPVRATARNLGASAESELPRSAGRRRFRAWQSGPRDHADVRTKITMWFWSMILSCCWPLQGLA